MLEKWQNVCCIVAICLSVMSVCPVQTIMSKMIVFRVTITIDTRKKSYTSSPNLWTQSFVSFDTCCYNMFGICPQLTNGPAGFGGCKNRACSVSCPEIIKGAPNQSLVCFVSYGRFLCLSSVFWVCVVFCFIVFGVSTSAIDCLVRLVSNMTYYVSHGMLYPTHSLTP